MGGSINNGGGGTITNDGTITNNSGGTVTNDGTITDLCRGRLVGFENVGGRINDILCAPRLLRPSVFSTNSTSGLTFSWQNNLELRTNVQYEWQIANASNPEVPVRTLSPVFGTSITIDSPPPGTYVWKVRAVNASVPLGHTVIPSDFSPPVVGIILDSTAATDLVGDDRTVTATVASFDAGLTFDHVTFTVTGSNPLGPRDVLVDPSTGQARFTYTGSNVGADVITATASDRGFTVTATATEEWVTVALELSPSNAANPVGTGDTVRVTLTDFNGDPVSASVTFTVSGANSLGPVVVATDPHTGNADLTYTGNNAGTDTITATIVTPEGVILTSEVTKTWVLGFLDLSPSEDTNSVGTNLTVTATLTGINGAPLSGVLVYFTVDGANTGVSGAAVTDANGQAFFTYTGTNPGTDTITATAQIGGPALTESATTTWEQE